MTLFITKVIKEIDAWRIFTGKIEGKGNGKRC